MKFTLIVLAMMTAYAADDTTRDITRATQARTAVESGRVGAKQRRAAKPFDGNPMYPVNPQGAAKAGSPQNAAAYSGSPASIVAIKSYARATRLQAGTAKTVRNAATKTARADVAYDPFDPRAQMISPEDGSVLAPTQTFEWSAGDGVSDYYLQIGSCDGCADLLNEDEGMNQVRTVPLPVDGRMIYVALFSWIDTDWYEIDYQYQASSGEQPVAAAMLSPVNGATLAQTQTFTWDGGYGVSGYYLQIGSCEGCSDLWNVNEGGNTSDTAPMPTDGRTIYARLFSLINGTWYYYDYQYRAPMTTAGNTVRVNIANPFAYPVNISINGQVVGSVDPFSTQGTNVTLTSLSLSFELVQPALNGKALGDQMAGIFDTIQNPSGTYLFQLSNQIGDSFYFLPVITNQTAQALELEVNGGLTAQNQCGCDVPANTQNVAAGYYLLYSNSNVRLYLPNSNYNGSYEYFGTAANPLYKLITDSSAEVRLTVNQIP